MAKIVRKLARIFGVDSNLNQKGVIGSFAAGAPTTSADIETLQSLPEYLGGMSAVVLGSNSPAIEDLNSLFLVPTYQLAYLMQEGISEWEAQTTYYIGSIVNDGNGNVYRSTIDTNLNNAVTDNTKWIVLNSSSSDILNVSLSASVAANALTISLKNQQGNNPVASSPASVSFRSSVLATGTFNVRSATASLSLVIPSGTTIGTKAGSTEYLWVYLLDNAGTLEIAVSRSRVWDENIVQTTTAISGGSSSTTLYSTTARTGVPIKLIGRITISEATAGTWATAPTVISNINNSTFGADSTVYCQGGNGYPSIAATTFRWEAPSENIGSDITITQSATEGDSFTINTPGIYFVSAVADNTITASTPAFGITMNSSGTATDINSLPGNQVLAKVSAVPYSTGIDTCLAVNVVKRLYPGDILRGQSNGSSNCSSGNDYAYFRVTRICD